MRAWLIIFVLAATLAQTDVADKAKITASRNSPAATVLKLRKNELSLSRFRREPNKAIPFPLSVKGERMGFPVFRPENPRFILLYIQPKIII
jgi:hypothetical protein